MRKYHRDRRGRFARTSGSKKYGRIGATLGAALLVGGPAYMPIGGAAGFAAGRAIDRAVTRRR